MPGTTLGTAYVQIVPSAKGISGSLQKALKGESDKAGSAAGLNVAGKIKSAIAAAGIGAAVSVGLKKAIEEGGKLQQSIGGIETLFGAGGRSIQEFAKDSGKSVKAVKDEYNMLQKAQTEALTNAQNAYQTAGLSANDYMQTITSFAAALKSSGASELDAARAADSAVIAMADNANKMGTDMQSIQNAYQGFAKQNYTMLDNLKLGYGGTKTEMQRLLDDASKLSGVEYNIDNLSDVYSAIKVIQDDLGITGTTAKEAASTFEGSFASMKAAAANFAGSLAIGENVEGSMKGLAESMGTFLFGNLFPMVGQVFQSLPAAAAAFMQTGLPAIKESGSALIKQIASGVAAKAPELANRIPQIIGRGMNSITKNLPGVLNQGAQLIQKLADGAWKAIPLLAKTAGNAITQFTNFVIKNLPAIASAGGDLLKNLASGFIKNLPLMLSALGGLSITILQNIDKLIPKLLSAGGELIVGLASGIAGPALTAVRGAMGKVQEGIRQPIQKAQSIITGIVQAIRSHLSFSGLFATVYGAFNAAKSAITGPIETAKNTISGIVQTIKGFFSFSVPTPHVPLPHFSVSPAGWKVSDLLKGSIPSLGVSWYAKGGVFNGPSLIGVGEATNEAVIPLSGRYMRPFAKTIAEEMGGAGTVYNIGDVTLSVEELKDVLTLEQFVNVIRRAKAFA